MFGGFAADLAGELTSSASAAIVGGLVAGPVGAAVGVASGDVTSAAIRALLDSQDNQIATLADLSEQIDGRLTDISGSIDLLLDSPLGEARMQLEQAARARTPERRERDILAARDALFRAYNQTRLHARRSLVGQALAACFALDGDPEQASEWLHRSYTEALTSVSVESERLDERFELTREPVGKSRRGRRPFPIALPEVPDDLQREVDVASSLAEDTIAFRRALIQIGLDETRLLKGRLRVGYVLGTLAFVDWNEIASVKGEPDALIIKHQRDSWEHGVTFKGEQLHATIRNRTGPQSAQMWFDPTEGSWTEFWSWMSERRSQVEVLPYAPEYSPIGIPILDWSLLVEGGPFDVEAGGREAPPGVVIDAFDAAERLLCSAPEWPREITAWRS